MTALCCAGTSPHRPACSAVNSASACDWALHFTEATLGLVPLIHYAPQGKVYLIALLTQAINREDGCVFGHESPDCAGLRGAGRRA